MVYGCHQFMVVGGLKARVLWEREREREGGREREREYGKKISKIFE